MPRLGVFVLSNYFAVIYVPMYSCVHGSGGGHCGGIDRKSRAGVLGVSTPITLAKDLFLEGIGVIWADSLVAIRTLRFILGSRLSFSIASSRRYVYNTTNRPWRGAPHFSMLRLPLRELQTCRIPWQEF
jgi:hypothetical protein